MHKRLRRQLDEALGQESEASPHLRKLFRKIEREYRRADGDRASLQRALALLSDLLKRRPEAERRRGISPRTRSVSRLFEQAPFAALLCDADRKVTAWNAAAERLFAIPEAEAVERELSMLVFPDTGANRAQARTELRQALANGDTTQLVCAKGDGGAPSEWFDRVHPADQEAVRGAIRAHLDGRSERFESEHRLRHEGGTWHWVLARGQATRDASGKALRFSGSTMDVTEPKATAGLLHDALTGLPNRAHFLDLARRSFARTRRREGDRLALLFLDVDRFKPITERLGNAAGDELLIKVGERLHTCLRECDTLARQGGDDFSILLDDVEEPADAEIVARRIHDVTSQPFEVSGVEVCATVSIGIALSASAHARVEDLLLDADAAMYRAKAQGRARSVVFDASLRERAPHLFELEGELRHALVREEFRVHYLPIVDVASGRIQGLEALIRWAHPTRGLIAPEHFVPFAEETGLMVPIGRWLLGQAGREFQSWRGAAPERLTLSVNLSSRQLEHSDLLENIEGVLAEHGLEAQDLILELTENTLQNGEHAGRM